MKSVFHELGLEASAGGFFPKEGRVPSLELNRQVLASAAYSHVRL